MDGADCDGAFADRGRHALGRPAAHVARSEHPRQTRFQGERRAVEAPRWAHTDRDQVADFPHLGPTELRMESRFARGVADDLRRRGHPVTEIGPLEGPCSLEIITRNPTTGILLAGSDPRRDGWALAW